MQCSDFGAGYNNVCDLYLPEEKYEFWKCGKSPSADFLPVH